MKGTKKQLEWAEEIKVKVENTFEGFLADAKNHSSNTVLEDNMEYVSVRLNALRTAEYAGDIISL